MTIFFFDVVPTEKGSAATFRAEELFRQSSTNTKILVKIIIPDFPVPMQERGNKEIRHAAPCLPRIIGTRNFQRPEGFSKILRV
jgi:hypothetical protein